MRVIQISRPRDLKKLMREIRVDPYGVKIMLPKGLTHLVRLNAVSSIAANILKQEMLSLGAEAAVAREALTGKTKKTDCLVMGNLAQFRRLSEKIMRQPFGLDKIGREFSVVLDNYQREEFTLCLGRHKLNLGKRTFIMGVVNLTPDSFSGDGFYSSIVHRPSSLMGKVIEFVEQMVRDGADIVDIGGESSRPGAKPVALKEELKRVIPAIKALAKKIKVPLSIDTRKPEVAKQALEAGASLVNDITALKDPQMVKVAARHKAGVVLMHMQGNPRTMQRRPRYASLLDEAIDFLRKAQERAQAGGISREKIIIDPGIGFGKALEHNLEILKHLAEFKVLGQPILVGLSRKSFIGKILNAAPEGRLSGTLAACVLAAKSGAKILRVHDVSAAREALRVADAVNKI